MNCDKYREQLPEVALGADSAPELTAHLADCSECSIELDELRKTMALLDEWQAPEPSPFFDTKMQALLREEQQKKQHAGWFAWLRRPSFGIAAVALLALGIGVYEGASHQSSSKDNKGAVAAIQRGTAVADLQFLDSHSEMLQDLDAMDSTDDDAQLN